MLELGEKMSNPINHHYVSKFYLDQFAFSKKKRDCKLFCFDKEHERKVVLKSTKKICSEKHRNTIEVFGEKEFFVETSLGELEGILADTIKFFSDFYGEKRKMYITKYWLTLHNQHYFVNYLKYKRHSKFCIWNEYRRMEFVYCLDSDRYKSLPIPYQSRFEFYDTYRINSVCIQEIKNDIYFNKIMSLYISLFYWRLPENDNKNFVLSKNQITTALSKLGLNKQASEVTMFGDDVMFIAQNTIRTEDLNTTYRNLLYPFVSAEMNNIISSLNAYIVKVPEEIVSSDYPFILLGNESDLADGFIFIWSESYVLIFSSDIPKIQDDKYFCELISLHMYFNAKRYAYSKSKEYLEYIVKTNDSMSDTECNGIKHEITALLQA